MSEPHTFARAILMRAAPGSGCGTGYSRISKGLPVPWNTAIRPVSAMGEDLLWWAVSYRNGRARLAGFQLVDVLDEGADLERLGDLVGEVEVLARRPETLDGDDVLFDQHHGERVDLRGELLDDVGVTPADADNHLRDELLLLGGELVHGGGLGHVRGLCEGHATEFCGTPEPQPVS